METLFRKDADGTYEAAPPAEVMATAAELAALELTRRGPEGIGPEELKPLVKAFLAKHDHELMCVAYLDARERLIEFKVVSEGSVSEVMMPIREIVKTALTNTALAAILIHNHPGSTAYPSEQDKNVAAFARVALKLFEVRMHDAWIVAGNEIYSMAEHDVKELRRRLPKELDGLIKALKAFDPEDD